MLTSDGIWRRDEGDLHRICKGDFQRSWRGHLDLYPLDDETFLVGAEYFTARVKVVDGKCEQEWFVPAACSDFERDGNRIVCSQGALKGKDVNKL